MFFEPIHRDNRRLDTFTQIKFFPSNHEKVYHHQFEITHICSLVAYIYSPDYVKVSCLLPAHPKRPILVHSLINAYGLFQSLKLIAPEPATDADLKRFHSLEYIDALKKETPQKEFGLYDDAQPFKGYDEILLSR